MRLEFKPINMSPYLHTSHSSLPQFSSFRSTLPRWPPTYDLWPLEECIEHLRHEDTSNSRGRDHSDQWFVFWIILGRSFQLWIWWVKYLRSVSKPTNVYITYRIITLKFRSSFFASKRLCFIDVYSIFIFAFSLPFFAF